jgi:hypothetical protein
VRFEFAFAPSYLRLSRVLRINPATAWVEVGEETFEARFGFYRVRTPLANVAGVEITGPYAFWKTAGPARYAITDRGLTFASNGERGLRIDFIEPVRGLDPFGKLRHPELTVTVADVEGLAAALSARERGGSAPAAPADPPPRRDR